MSVMKKGYCRVCKIHIRPGETHLTWAERNMTLLQFLAHRLGEIGVPFNAPSAGGIGTITSDSCLKKDESPSVSSARTTGSERS
jgi:hypothetical protein